MWKVMVHIVNLVSSLEHGEVLRFKKFLIRKVDFQADKKLFGGSDIYRNHHVYEREFDKIPGDPGLSGLGDIGLYVERDLFFFRLFKPGPISFSRLIIVHEDQQFSQYPYWAIRPAETLGSYRFSAEDCPRFDAFSEELSQRPAFSSGWFQLAYRYFLYGSGLELNPRFDLLDPIINYVIAMESCLVIERDFVSRRIRERAAALTQNDAVSRHVNKLYDIRSRAAHGSSLSGTLREFLQKNRQMLEETVRSVLVSSLRQLPAANRSEVLKQLFDVTDADRGAYYKRELAWIPTI